MRAGGRKALLAVAFVITVTAALAAFGLIPKLREQRKIRCLVNLRQIDSAIINVAIERGYHRGYVIRTEQFAWCLMGDQIPACPSGGRYAIPPVGGHTLCSYHGDLLAQDGWLKLPSLLDGKPLK